MSERLESESGVMNRCASCGVKENEDVKLKDCGACHLVKYCGRKCQKEHRPQHKRACKQRAAELRDEILFKQPESTHYGDCPICCLPLPLDPKKSIIMMCCSKVICHGCCYANEMRELQGKLGLKCPFCRTPPPSSEKEGDKRLKNRAEMNDPIAMFLFGTDRHKAGDNQTALKYLSRAADLGDARSHYKLAVMHRDGSAPFDESKAVYHDEQAAIGGHPTARHNLGCMEWKKRRYERTIKHWIIAAKLGLDESLNELKNAYQIGLVSKNDLTAALRGHQAAVDATKSPQREEAEGVYSASPFK